MSRSRLSRCLLPAVLLATLAPTGASAQPAGTRKPAGDNRGCPRVPTDVRLRRRPAGADTAGPTEPHGRRGAHRADEPDLRCGSRHAPPRPVDARRDDRPDARYGSRRPPPRPVGADGRRSHRTARVPADLRLCVGRTVGDAGPSIGTREGQRVGAIAPPILGSSRHDPGAEWVGVAAQSPASVLARGADSRSVTEPPAPRAPTPPSPRHTSFASLDSSAAGSPASWTSPNWPISASSRSRPSARRASVSRRRFGSVAMPSRCSF